MNYIYTTDLKEAESGAYMLSIFSQSYGRDSSSAAPFGVKLRLLPDFQLIQ